MTQQTLDLDTVAEGELVTYRMVLPFLPPSKNVADNWPAQWRAAAKKKWIRAISARAAELGMPLGCQRVGLAAQLVFARRARRDVPNYAQYVHHWVFDALVACGVLVDDSDGRVHVGPNWGVQLVVDSRAGAGRKVLERTVLAITVEKAVPRKGTP